MLLGSLAATVGAAVAGLLTPVLGLLAGLGIIL